MSVPSFLSESFRYVSTAAVVDVNTIIADLMTELVTNGTWTDEGGTGVGPFKSPVDTVDGSFITITLTRTSATRLSFAIVDSFGLNPYNSVPSLDIDAGGTEVRYYTGPSHVVIESTRATPEVWWTARTNQWPEEVGKVAPSFVFSSGPRLVGSLGGQEWSKINFRRLGTTSYVVNSNVASVGRCMATGTTVLVSLTGAYMFLPFDTCDDTQNIWGGRIPQCLLVDDQHAGGIEFTVPIDTGVTGVFKVSGLPAASDRKIAWRKE